MNEPEGAGPVAPAPVEPAPPTPVPPVPPAQGVGRRWAAFYVAFFHDLRDNLAIMAPLIVVFALVIVPASSALLCAFECGGSVRDFWEAAYVTWQAMTTSGGFGDNAPATVPGRVLVSVDAILGYSLLGVIVFTVARAAEKEGRVHDV